MPQTPTPLPQSLAESVDLSVEVEEEDSRTRRLLTPSDRPVSDLAPVLPSLALEAVDEGLLEQEDHSFVTALHGANVALELDGAELARAAQLARCPGGPGRRIDLLDAYYQADGDPPLGLRRQVSDRWFLYNASDGLTATSLAQRLLTVVPELGWARLERIGGPDGALILRAGEHVCGVEDDRLEDGGLATISVRDMVRAFNVLLDRHGVRTRLVGLCGDGAREAYIGQPSMGSAIALAKASYLDACDAESLMQRTAW